MDLEKEEKCNDMKPGVTAGFFYYQKESPRFPDKILIIAMQCLLVYPA